MPPFLQPLLIATALSKHSVVPCCSHEGWRLARTVKKPVAGARLQTWWDKRVHEDNVLMGSKNIMQQSCGTDQREHWVVRVTGCSLLSWTYSILYDPTVSCPLATQGSKFGRKAFPRTQDLWPLDPCFRQVLPIWAGS